MRLLNGHAIGWVLAATLLFPAPRASSQEDVHVTTVFELISPDKSKRKAAGKAVLENWRNAYTPMLLELESFADTPSLSSDLWKLIEKGTGKRFGRDNERAYNWVWQNDFGTHPSYNVFKAYVYRQIDERFFQYFNNQTDNAKIRLDEIRWGGVRRDGIPPLKNPVMIPADEARYLKDSNIVFGIEVNGDVRAYPKRILAWHEMFKDTVGGVSVNGVYCTLCGTVILYETEHDGVHYELGTSGFLYRSNKLMYDHSTESLWSTVKGEPVVGPLVDKGIKLKPRYVVTTTWGQWKERHPDTTVLSLDTGHRRDYGEGVAYRDYFATDELMFTTPFSDKRLKNKDEVFVLRFGGPGETPRAYSVKFLSKNNLVQSAHGGIEYVLITDQSGATRAYESGGMDFKWANGQLLDTQGGKWRVTESQLESEAGRALQRLPSHRAFWFGWHAAHPDTELIK